MFAQAKRLGKNLGTETLIEGFVNGGDLDEAQDHAKRIGRELRIDELERVCDVSTRKGWIFTALKCMRLLGNEITDSFLKELAKNANTKNKFRIAKALSDEAAAIELMRGCIRKWMSSSFTDVQGKALRVVEYLDQYGQEVVKVKFSRSKKKLFLTKIQHLDAVKISGLPQSDFQYISVDRIKDQIKGGKVEGRRSLLDSFHTLGVIMYCEECNEGVEYEKGAKCPVCEKPMEYRLTIDIGKVE
jgi:hypothetical protein